MTKTLYWYDFEAGGANPRVDRPSQFAGIRTDEQLNIISEPLVEYCQLAPDYLPHPEACLITGITPQKQRREGLIEAEFAALIHAQFSTPGTTIAGYNNLRFDDEMTRFMLYRNFYDPYAYSWQNDNSRWDLVDLVRACYALRPDGIEWPQVDDKVSFKLELLSQANGIAHTQAHDAMSDVYATIGMAQRIKQAQPRLYDYYYQKRRKSAVAQLLDEALVQAKPLVHISAHYGTEQGNVTWVLPLAHHPSQANTVIAWRLDNDPNDWRTHSPEAIREALYTRKADLQEQGITRPGLVTISTNKCPFIAPASTLEASRAETFGLDWATAMQARQTLIDNHELRDNLLQVFQLAEPPAPMDDDVDAALYSGPFFSQQAKSQMEMIRGSHPDQLGSLALPWDDARLPEMLFRYRARNFGHTLSHAEQQKWRRFCQERLMHGYRGGLSVDDFVLKLEHLAEVNQQNSRNMAILKALAEYIQSL